MNKHLPKKNKKRRSEEQSQSVLKWASEHFGLSTDQLPTAEELGL